jgi:hypothetical protein
MPKSPPTGELGAQTIRELAQQDGPRQSIRISGRAMQIISEIEVGAMRRSVPAAAWRSPCSPE